MPDAITTLFKYIKGKFLSSIRNTSNPIHVNNQRHNSSKMESSSEKGNPQIESNVFIKARNGKYQHIESVVINLVNEVDLMNKRLDQIDTR